MMIKVAAVENLCLNKTDYICSVLKGDVTNWFSFWEYMCMNGNKHLFSSTKTS